MSQPMNRTAYAPYDTLPSFDEGMAAYWIGQLDNPHNPNSVAAQAWDRGRVYAMRIARSRTPCE